MSGNSLRIADGFIMAPDSRCEPGPLPFSTSATGTSPSDSISCSSSASSWVSRIAQASPAGPPPTIATPTSIRSSSGSVGGAMNSLAESTGGGYSIGAVGISSAQSPVPSPQERQRRRGPSPGDWLLGTGDSSLFRLHCLRELRQDLVQIPDDPEI